MVKVASIENILTKAFTTLPLIGLVSTLNTSPAAAQEYQSDPAARLWVLGINVVGNSLICGVVAAAEGRDMLNDVGQCFGGATLQYIGMEMGAHDVPVLPGFGLRTVETGTSIIENTLIGRKPFEQLQYELGPMLYQINLKEKEVGVYWRAAPIAGFIYFAAQGYELSWPETFSRQTFVFHAPSILKGEDQERGIIVYNTGRAIGNVMSYDSRYPEFGAHEFMHVLQYARFRPAQLLVPKSLDFFENTLRYRMAEDAVSGIFWGVGEIGCASLHFNVTCDKHWWNLRESEAYIMPTAHKKYDP